MVEAIRRLPRVSKLASIGVRYRPQSTSVSEYTLQKRTAGGGAFARGEFLALSGDDPEEATTHAESGESQRIYRNPLVTWCRPRSASSRDASRPRDRPPIRCGLRLRGKLLAS